MEKLFDAATGGSRELANIGQHRLYPDYKDSEIEWIGDIPAHWNIKAARREYAIRLGKMLQSMARGPQDSQTRYFKAQHVHWEFVRTTDLPTMYAGPIDQAHYGVVDGDLLVCEGGVVGRAGIVRNPPLGSIIQNALHRIRSIGSSDICFLMYLLRHAASRDWIGILCNRATIAHFTSEKIGDLMIPWAPLSEQRAIVGFLERETAKIDALVTKKERLIELLAEQRRAIITRAVTKGIDSNVSMKDSGIDWMGDLPEHWYLAALRRRSSVIDCKHITVPFVNEGIPLASVRETQSFELDLSDAKCTTYDWYETLIEGGRRPRPGDVIYCRNVNVGAATLVTTEDRFAMGQDVCLIRSRLDNPRWLNYFLSSSAMSHQLASVAVGSTFDRINVSEIMSLLVPIVPQHEQESISRFLDREVAKIDALSERVLEAIARLRELRAFLISAAVTGKIDVRETAS